MEILISFVAGMILSGGAVYLLLRAHMRQAKEEARTYAQELLSAKEQAHREAMASLENHHQQALLSEQQRYEEMLAKVSAEMKATTEQMLRQRQSELQESNTLHMQQIVSPLKDTIQRMETALKENRSTQETSTEAIKEKIATLVSTTMKVSDSAERLSNALTAENKTQGNWGEQKIESLLTSIGLERGLEYDAQEYLRDAAGNIIVSDESSRRMQPDIILHLDETRDLIIDSKVSLNAFVDYTNADDDQGRSVALAGHLRSVRNHVKELSKKNYAAYVRSPRQSVDFVMMFVPVDGALQLALSADPTLWREAMNQGVFIVGEQNLYAALRAVQVTWTTIKQNANNKAICDTAEELLNRVGDFMEKFNDLGKRLEKVNEAYESVSKKATSGQSVLGSARKLVKLGAKASTVHPLPLSAGEGE
ncbi:MAG: DNA recombination protein RmuC [Paludibacteraceae bacterium]|nr:DNA recombination protein RmuC [Paludibacteraceae bacterium]